MRAESVALKCPGLFCFMPGRKLALVGSCRTPARAERQAEGLAVSTTSFPGTEQALAWPFEAVPVSEASLRRGETAP